MTAQAEVPPGRPGRRGVLRRAAVAVVVAVAVFGFALPALADYGEAGRVVAGMTTWQVAIVAVTALVHLVTYWPVLVLATPGLRWTEAAVVNQASTAVANTVPAGGAVALGVSYRMLRAWGFTSQSVANQLVATAVLNVLVKAALPVVAVVAVASTGELGASSVWVAVTGLAALAVLGGGAAWVLAAEGAARRFGTWLDRLAWRVRRRTGRPRRPPAVAPWLLVMRGELVVLLRHRGWLLTVATVVSHMSLYVVLLATLRAAGVPEDAASWARVLAGFAFVRLLSALPITPGGFGVVELGYVAFLTAGAGADGLADEITAAVLVFRAATFLLPVLLGAASWAVFALRSSWRNPPDTRGVLVDDLAAPA